MTVPYSPFVVANTFIGQFGGDTGIEHMKLQKLVYYSYAWWLASKGLDEKRLTTKGPEMWKYGPVFSALYDVLKVFGRRKINTLQSPDPFLPPEEIAAEDRDVRGLLSWIWSRYGHLSGLALSGMTHEPGTSWHRTAVKKGFRVSVNEPIPDECIFEEFRKLLKAA